MRGLLWRPHSSRADGAALPNPAYVIRCPYGHRHTVAVFILSYCSSSGIPALVTASLDRIQKAITPHLGAYGDTTSPVQRCCSPALEPRRSPRSWEAPLFEQ
ncbi:Uncharacterized protein HZ326_29103 [Fusarium oxysporum f. sp. albedinis]|nr:Uncharacterized protein HZ326_29103 [Fusarium oxysporum f. sp. albedinis]